jgi:hypothetical protein
MPRVTSSGKCTFCGGTVGKSAMTRHLTSCKARPAEPEKAPGRRGRPTTLFHLVVGARYAPPYWLHLEAPANATLDDLDSFLRRTWLECCGHLSAFRLGGRSFSPLAAHDDWNDDENLNVKLGELLEPGMTFSYEYDFGTTTELTLKVAGQREGLASGREITLLAGNHPPAIPCEACEGAATQVCSQCIYEGGGPLCQKCARKHKCGRDMLLPIVNSPRAGMCGYDGPGLTL